MLGLTIRGLHALYNQGASRSSLDDRDVTAVEFALIAPILVLMAISIADLGFGLYRAMQVQNAAQTGAEYAMAHGYDSTAISNAVVSGTTFTAIGATPAPSQYCGCATNTGVTAAVCTALCPSGAVPGHYVQVSAQATYKT